MKTVVITLAIVLFLAGPSCSGKMPQISDKLQYIFNAKEIDPCILYEFYSPEDQNTFRKPYINTDAYINFKIDQIKELRDKKVKILPVEYLSECGKEYACVYYSEDWYWGGKAKKLLFNFIKINDEWKITEFPYRVFLSEPGKEVKGLALELSSDKEKYSISKDKEIVLKIKLTNKSKSPVKIIGDRWEVMENIFLRVKKLPDCEGHAIVSEVGLVDYAGFAHFHIIKPGEYLEKNLNQKDEVVWMPDMLKSLSDYGCGRYNLYFVYTQYLGSERSLQVDKDEWSGRLTSNPILLEITQ
jgi:hypothetical protein